MITPCMQALHAAQASQFIMSPNGGGQVHVVNQISHAKGAAIHSYNNTASNGFNPAGAAKNTGYINNASFNSAQ